MLKKCFISYVVGNDCSSHVKSFCLVTTELMMGLTIILLDPGWTALEELMSKVRTIFGQLSKSQNQKTLTFVANHPPIFCMSVSCPCDHTADTSNLICLHFIKVPHQAVLLDEALPKGTPMLEVRWGL